MYLTEMVGAFVVGYSLGSLISPPDTAVARPGPPRGGRPGSGVTLPVFLGLLGAVIAALYHIDLRDLSLTGRAQRNALTSYLGWDARVIERIPAGGFGEIAMRDGSGNIISVAATADVDIAEGTTVRVTATRDLNIVVTPEPTRAP
ncbi:MAG TPA: hypothetical protein VEU77_07995 [Candidatus Acidoferrales bacterium]|nr:hypothetical protein [Candidatus Acidoferrales bacterium]